MSELTEFVEWAFELASGLTGPQLVLGVVVVAVAVFVRYSGVLDE